jgi:MscS family membrane protein
VREDLLLRTMEIVEDAGTALAQPAQTLYLARDAGLAKEKTENAVKKIADLRDGKKLPFPDFHKDDVASFKGSIAYPAQDSAVNNQGGGSGKS